MSRASPLLDQQREIYSSGAVVRGIASRGFCRNSNLNVDIAFESLDPDGCDHVILPDRKNAAIPKKPQAALGGALPTPLPLFPWR